MTFSALISSIRVLLTGAQKRRYLRYQVFFIFAGALQLVGAGSVAPFIGILSRPELLRENKLAASTIAFLGLGSDLEAIVLLAIAMIVVLILSNVSAAVAVWLTFRFSLDVGAEIKNDLLNCYLQREYVRLAGTNSSDLINRISTGAPRFAFNVLQPLMTIASQGALLFVILTGLALYQPSVLIAFGGLIGGGYILLFLIVRSRLERHGQFTWAAGQRVQRLLLECLGGLKEIRLSGTEERYRAEHYRTTRAIFRSEALIGVLGDVPRFLLETVAISALLLMAIVMLLSGSSSSSVIAALTLYAMAGYRMLPAGQAIYKAVAQVRANMAVIGEILPDILEARRLPKPEQSISSGVQISRSPKDIIIDDLWFSYPSSVEPVLRGISARIPANSLTVIVGASGSGKSTLSDLLLGLLPPAQGSVLIGDVPLEKLGKQWFEAVGYVPQSIFLLDDSLAANVSFGSRHGTAPERLRRSLDQARLTALVASLPEGIEYRVGERGARLSGGQRQRVGLARALYHDASYLVLDEATSALDGRTESEVLDTLLELRKERTVVMIAHRVTTIRAADYIIMLENGRVAAEGAFDDLRRSSDAFAALVREGDRLSGTSRPTALTGGA